MTLRPPARPSQTRARLAATAQYGRNIDDGGTLADRRRFRPGAGHERDAPRCRTLPSRPATAPSTSPARRHWRRAGGPEQGPALHRQQQAPGPQHIRRQLGCRQRLHPGPDPSTRRPRNPPASTGQQEAPWSGASVPTRLSGSTPTARAIFGNGAGSIFDTVSHIAAHLRTGDR